MTRQPQRLADLLPGVVAELADRHHHTNGAPPAMTEQFTPVTCRGKDGKTVVVQGEATPITAVYLTPYVDFNGPRYSGDWCLTHAPTGRCFPCRSVDADDIRDLAERLATVSDDWTDFPEDGSQWPDDVKVGLVRVTTEWHAERDDESILFVRGGAA